MTLRDSKEKSSGVKKEVGGGDVRKGVVNKFQRGELGTDEVENAS